MIRTEDCFSVYHTTCIYIASYYRHFFCILSPSTLILVSASLARHLQEPNPIVNSGNNGYTFSRSRPLILRGYWLLGNPCSPRTTHMLLSVSEGLHSCHR